ncbi:MAG: hypothetical protein VW258_07145 [Thalassolituus sp.]
MIKLVSVIAGLLIGCGVVFLYGVLPKSYIFTFASAVISTTEAVSDESDSLHYLFKVELWGRWLLQTLAMLLPIGLLSAIAVVIKTWTKESRFLVYSVLMVAVLTFFYWGVLASSLAPLLVKYRALAQLQCYLVATQAGLFFVIFVMIDAIFRRYQPGKRS